MSRKLFNIFHERIFNMIKQFSVFIQRKDAQIIRKNDFFRES